MNSFLRREYRDKSALLCFLALLCLVLMSSAQAEVQASAQLLSQLPSQLPPQSPSHSPSAATLPAVVMETLTRVNLQPDQLGAYVVRIADGAVLVAHNADKPMHPGSTFKLVTALAAFDHLGPNFRARTALLTDGLIVDGVLNAPLYLRGAGATNFSIAALQDLLETLRHQGLRELRGDLVLDRTLYQPARMDINVLPFDEFPFDQYTVIPDALMLNQNLLRLRLSADKENLRVSLSPKLDGVTLKHDMALSNSPCAKAENEFMPPTIRKDWRGHLSITLHGSFPRDCSATKDVNLLDRTDYAEAVVRTLWQKMGGSFSGKTREGKTPTQARILAEHQDRTLTEAAYEMNKASNNVIARILFLNIGSYTTDNVVSKRPTRIEDKAEDTLDRARRLTLAWIAAQGIATDGIVLENGSGLSRIERIKPAQMGAILQRASASPWAPELRAGLPLTGMDGTMTNRLRNSPAAGQARLKTGTLNDVSTNAGYLRDARGREYVLVAFVNALQANASERRKVLDALIDWVARYDADDTP